MNQSDRNSRADFLKEKFGKGVVFFVCLYGILTLNDTNMKSVDGPVKEDVVLNRNNYKLYVGANTHFVGAKVVYDYEDGEDPDTVPCIIVYGISEIYLRDEKGEILIDEKGEPIEDLELKYGDGGANIIAGDYRIFNVDKKNRISR